MSETARMWMEITFNVTYLVVIYAIIIGMWRRREAVDPDNRPVANGFLWAFALLALGDTGHVGFRVVAYAMGGLEATLPIFGREIGLVGLGSLSTAITITLFYAIYLVIWRRRFGKPYGWFGLLLFAAAAVRLAMIALPQNQWNEPEPVQPWSILRNLPLILAGLGVAYLMLRDALAEGGGLFKWMGALILVSYAFYLPVIFFVLQVPMLGMLMIPKTVAYMIMAWVAYVNLYAGQRHPAAEAEAAL